MKLRSLLLLAAMLTLMAQPVQAWRGRVGIGIGVGVPVGPFYGPYYRGYYSPYGYAYPYPYAAPVVISPAPVVVQPPPIISPAPTYGTQPPITPPPPPPMPPANHSEQSVLQLLAQLGQADENVRRTAIIELGRLRIDQAVEPLTGALTGDITPAVRDAAARSLGLIASPRALPALIHAAQADNDRDVRRSAQYAIEIIRSQMRR